LQLFIVSYTIASDTGSVPLKEEVAMAETKSTPTQVGRDAADRLRETVSTNELAQKAKDAAYTIVGLGVMGAQKATAASKSAAKQFGLDDSPSGLDFDSIRGKTNDAKEIARRQFTKADGVLGGALARIEEAFAPFEEKLPDSAKVTVNKVRDAGKGIHATVRTKVAGDQPVDEPKHAKKDADVTDA
jgi:hypothetical protein